MLISKFAIPGETIDLENFEMRIGKKIPVEYYKFLQKYNGGSAPKTKWTGKGKSDIRGFMGVKTSDSSWDIEEQLKYDLLGSLLEKNLLPIAKNVSGDYFCIKCDDGTIWLAYHDSDKTLAIADSFNNFISKCKSQKIGHIRTIEERKQGMKDAGIWHLFTEDLVEDWQAEIDKYGNMVQEEVII